MVGLETFGAAALKFSTGVVSRLFRDARVRGMLNTLYAEAARQVVNDYEGNITSEQDRDDWNSIIDLLMDPRCGEYLSVGGTFGYQEIRLLQLIYHCETPSVFDVVERMALEMVNVCVETMPNEPSIGHIVPRGNGYDFIYA